MSPNPSDQKGRPTAHGRRTAPVIGRVVAVGLVDEITDRQYVIVDGADGRVHYAELGRLRPDETPARGMIVSLVSDRLEGKPRSTPRLTVLSPVELERLPGYDGPTWLDRAVTAKERISTGPIGFGAELSQALDERRKWLSDRQLAEFRPSGEVVAKPQMTSVLQQRERAHLAETLSLQMNAAYMPNEPGSRVSGVNHPRSAPMSWRLHRIVLYSHDGRRHHLPKNGFKASGISTIVGDSNTGKSAILEIVNYCLGSSECEIADFVKRRCNWVGIQLARPNQFALLCRQVPEGARKSADAYFLKTATSEILPAGDELLTMGTGALEKFEHLLGIGAVVIEDKATQAGFTVSVRHCSAYCLVREDVITSRSILFSGARDEKKARHLRETLPYFLGHVIEEAIRTRDELRRRRAELRSREAEFAQRSLNVAEDMQDDVVVLSAAMKDIIAQLPFAAEYRGAIPIFDWKVLQVHLRDGNRKVPMASVGSDENYLAIHIAFFVAIHRLFAARKRPVLQFVIFDQVTRPYFPDSDYKEIVQLPPQASADTPSQPRRLSDEVAKVRRIFATLFKLAAAPDTPQIVVCEKANFQSDPQYQASIVEFWATPNGMVPVDWQTKD